MGHIPITPVILELLAVHFYFIFSETLDSDPGIPLSFQFCHLHSLLLLTKRSYIKHGLPLKKRVAPKGRGPKTKKGD